jgi:regulator of replication initiation timing
MSNKDETPATRLWRDKAQIREQERDEARARLRVAEEKVAILMAENAQLTAENARLRGLLNPNAGRARSETERQMAELRGALMPLLADPTQTTH